MLNPRLTSRHLPFINGRTHTVHLIEWLPINWPKHGQELIKFHLSTRHICVFVTVCLSSSSSRINWRRERIWKGRQDKLGDDQAAAAT